MLLNKLINNCPKKLIKIKIKGLALNSNDVKKGFIFFAIKGVKFNGEDYINHAIRKGAVLIICSKKYNFKNQKTHFIRTNKIRSLLSELSSKFYSLKPKNIFAVTGTNGKTSVAEFFYQILSANKIPVASIGTFGIKVKDKVIKTNLTSPDTITLHKNLETLKKNKINNVIIEASSHGLDQCRLNNIKFKAGIFTNFSQDHLDYHKTMKAYLNSKLILLKKLLPKKSFIITDSQIKEFKKIKEISQKRNLKLFDINSISNITKKFPNPILNSFQKKNLSMAFIVAKLCNLSNSKIENTLQKINTVEGRLELVKKFPDNVKVFIDYAHTPNALFESLNSIKKENNNITLVFGCGGERDFKKRPLMAKVAKIFCKKIYVTDDNPRKENPKKIRKEIIKQLKNFNYFDIGNRSKAIAEAIKNSVPNEAILIAGKGHENYQDYGNKIISISDKQIVKRLINNIKKRPKEKEYLSNSKILNRILNDKKIYRFDGLSIDSRDVKKDNLFLALKGKNSDGNKFIHKSLKKGAKYIVSSKKNLKNNKKYIKVKDSVKFLNQFAKLKRESSNAKVLAITGSAGKTSLKNILYNLLDKYGFTYASPKSFNNHFGVPVSLSNLKLSHRFGVFEIGMSKFGEINTLSKMVKPNFAIITNIGEAHIENFKNIKEIAKAKGEIINNIEKNGSVILNRDDKFFNYLKYQAQLRHIKVRTFGKSKNSDVQLIKIKKSNNEKIIIVKINKTNLHFKIKDINIYNVLASLAVLIELKLDIYKCLEIFKNLQPSEGRGKVYKVKRYRKNFKLIDDSYNANPLSVKNAIKNFGEIKKKKFKKYLLLGDMLELGKRSKIYHSELSKLINSSDIDKVFVIGEKSLFTFKNLIKNKRGNILQCDQDVDLILQNIIANRDYLMIKGSNATGLNTISKAMIKGI